MRGVSMRIVGPHAQLLIPRDECVAAVWGPLGDMLVAIWSGEDPPQAVADAQTAIEAAAPSR